MTLIDAFDIQNGDLIAIVGGGGKSSLLFGIERQWRGNSVVTTTTRIFAAQIARARTHITRDAIDQLGERLTQSASCLVIGATEGEKARGVPIEWPSRLLARADVDIVVVEADGSRMRPVKAPAEHEPVIPPETTLGVIMVGLDALAGPIEQVAHRPTRVCQLTHLQPHDTLTPAALTTLLTHPHGGLKSMPSAARKTVCLNKVDSAERHTLAVEIARQLLATGKISRVVLTQLQPTPLIKQVIRGRSSPGNPEI